MGELYFCKKNKIEEKNIYTVSDCVVLNAYSNRLIKYICVNQNIWLYLYIISTVMFCSIKIVSWANIVLQWLVATLYNHKSAKKKKNGFDTTGNYWAELCFCPTSKRSTLG